MRLNTACASLRSPHSPAASAQNTFKQVRFGETPNRLLSRKQTNTSSHPQTSQRNVIVPTTLHTTSAASSHSHRQQASQFRSGSPLMFVIFSLALGTPPPGNWTLQNEFSDEFDTLNLTKWNTSVKSWGSWSWAPENVFVFNGNLQLTMSYEEHMCQPGLKCYYRSGIAKSRKPSGIAFGYFEARIKGASRWPGVCPAFWAWRNEASLPAPVGYWTELDFVEMQESRSSSRDIDFTWHLFPPTEPKHLQNSSHQTFAFDPRDDFHIYGAARWTSALRWPRLAATCPCRRCWRRCCPLLITTRSLLLRHGMEQDGTKLVRGRTDGAFSRRRRSHQAVQPWPPHGHRPLLWTPPTAARSAQSIRVSNIVSCRLRSRVPKVKYYDLVQHKAREPLSTV
jgi:hypothetical protein